MRALALLLAITGCGFRSSAAPDAHAVDLDANEPHDGPPTADVADAVAVDADADAATPFCDPADPHLMACYELEGNGRDGSSHHLDAATTNVTFPAGQVGKAMLFGGTSTADVADSAVFDVANLTIEAWVRPAQLPTGGARTGILDMDGQYGLFIHANGDLQCSLAGPASPPTAAAQIAVDRWTHVACTYDGAISVLYVDGVAISSATTGGALHTNGTTGISLAADNPPGAGSRLSGLLDQVRLFDLARTAPQICQAAGRASCP